MPYSTGCKTPLSNFEAGQNYKVCHFTLFLKLLILFFNMFGLLVVVVFILCHYVIQFVAIAML